MDDGLRTCMDMYQFNSHQQQQNKNHELQYQNQPKKQPIFEHACNFVSHTVFWICVELLQMPRRNTSKEWLRVAASDHLIPRAPSCAIVCHTDEKELGLGPGHMPNLAWHAAPCKAEDSIPMALWSFSSRSWGITLAATVTQHGFLLQLRLSEWESTVDWVGMFVETLLP